MPRRVAYVGIDPGVVGGLAVINPPLGKRLGSVALIPMPPTERDIWDWIRGGGDRDPTHAMIEWIHPAIQGIGKSQMSKLYGNYMQLRMALTAADIPFEDVKPRMWLRALGISPRKKTETRTQWKNRLKAKAQGLYPDLKITLATADALLIATFCQRKHEGTLG